MTSTTEQRYTIEAPVLELSDGRSYASPPGSFGNDRAAATRAWRAMRDNPRRLVTYIAGDVDFDLVDLAVLGGIVREERTINNRTNVASAWRIAERVAHPVHVVERGHALTAPDGPTSPKLVDA